jgi:hypothetical protein
MFLYIQINILIMQSHYFIWQLLIATSSRLTRCITVAYSFNCAHAQCNIIGKWQLVAARQNKDPVVTEKVHFKQPVNFNWWHCQKKKYDLCTLYGILVIVCYFMPNFYLPTKSY